MLHRSYTARRVLEVAEFPFITILQRATVSTAASTRDTGTRTPTTQSASSLATGTSRGTPSSPTSHPPSTGASSTRVMTLLIVCVCTSTRQPSFPTVSNTTARPRWQRVSSAKPACAHSEPSPVHAPCGIGSAVWYTCVTGVRPKRVCAGCKPEPELEALEGGWASGGRGR